MGVSDLVKVDLLFNGQPVDAFTRSCTGPAYESGGGGGICGS